MEYRNFKTDLEIVRDYVAEYPPKYLPMWTDVSQLASIIIEQSAIVDPVTADFSAIPDGTSGVTPSVAPISLERQ